MKHDFSRGSFTQNQHRLNETEVFHLKTTPPRELQLEGDFEEAREQSLFHPGSTVWHATHPFSWESLRRHSKVGRIPLVPGRLSHPDADACRARQVHAHRAAFFQDDMCTGNSPLLKFLRSLCAAINRMAVTGLEQLPDTVLNPTSMDMRVQHALKAIETHPQKPLSNPALARLTGMNTNAFIRLFHTVVGQTPQAYSLIKRIDKASMRFFSVTENWKRLPRKPDFVTAIISAGYSAASEA